MTRASIRIRPADHADVDRLTVLFETADAIPALFGPRRASPQTGALAQRVADLIAHDSRTVLIAVDDTGAAAGMLVAKLDEIGLLESTPVLHVLNLVVLPSQRRRGIGRALLAGAVHLAEEQGVDRVLASVMSGSRDANRYLARLGFAPMVVARVAATSVLRRSLGLPDSAERLAVVRRARLMRAPRRVSARGA